MMNINEYFDNLFTEAGLNEEEWNRVMEYEQSIYELYEDDEAMFEDWAKKNNIDLTATETIGYTHAHTEYVVTLWAWDMCGD